MPFQNITRRNRFFKSKRSEYVQICTIGDRIRGELSGYPLRRRIFDAGRVHLLRHRPPARGAGVSAGVRTGAEIGPARGRGPAGERVRERPGRDARRNSGTDPVRRFSGARRFPAGAGGSSPREKDSGAGGDRAVLSGTGVQERRGGGAGGRVAAGGRGGTGARDRGVARKRTRPGKTADLGRFGADQRASPF